MFRTALLPLALSSALATTPAQAQDITGTWRIAVGESSEGVSYGGTVSIRQNGNCYSVTWILDTGEQYSGVGLIARGTALAVAYRSGPEAGYGVVFYAYNKTTGGIEGWWCQPDGRRGVENLSGTAFTGSHRLIAGSSTGTVELEPNEGGPNYDLTWTTSSGNYQGFATGLGGDSGMLAGVWGDLEGTGVVLYSLANVATGSMPGWWAASGSLDQGKETLER